jgi:ADP-ribosylglycohydrolase
MISENRTTGMLLGTAIGDTKGITYENLTYDDIQTKLRTNPRISHHNLFSPTASFIYLGTDNNHAFLKNYKPGKWTDSTQLSLAMAKALSKVEFSRAFLTL